MEKDIRDLSSIVVRTFLGSGRSGATLSNFLHPITGLAWSYPILHPNISIVQGSSNPRPLQSAECNHASSAMIYAFCRPGLASRSTRHTETGHIYVHTYIQTLYMRHIAHMHVHISRAYLAYTLETRTQTAIRVSIKPTAHFQSAYCIRAVAR